MSIQVQGTNDFSIVSKLSMVLREYIKDKYICSFVDKRARRSPLINLGYYVRAIVIEKSFIEFLTTVQHQSVQILSLGAGFDTSFFRLHDLPELMTNVTYFEIDLPDVVSRKSAIIKMNLELLNKLQDPKVDYSGCGIWSENYRLLAGDLRQISEIENILKDNGFDKLKPTLFLAECSITYMDEISSRRLIQFTQEFLENAAFVTYEQISPKDPFGIVMTNHFQTINSPLLSVSHYPTLEEQEKRFFSQGWSSCEAISVWEAFVSMVSESERFRALHLELFDEWEEWHLKCNHYALVIATKGSLNTWRPFKNFESLILKDNLYSQQLTSEVVELEIKQINVKQYGHSSVILPNETNGNYIVTIGGFGQLDNGTHKRLDGIRCMSVDKTCICEINSVSIGYSTFNTMHHSCSVVNECDRTFILYGGRQSPNKCVNHSPILIHSELINGCLSFTCTEIVEDTLDATRPEPRWRHSACVINYNGCSVFVVYGGCSQNLQVFGDLWKIRLTKEGSNQWEQVLCGKEYPCSRFSHSAVIDNDNMYISGGLNSKFEALSDIWAWNCRSEIWTQLAVDMIPRYGHTSHLVGNTLVLIGGVSTQRETWPGIALINIVSFKTTELVLPCLGPCRSVMFVNHSSVVQKDESIYIIGGGASCFSFGTKFNENIVKVPLAQWTL